MRRLAESLRGRRLFDEVAVAFHQGEPGFDTVLDELTADEVTVVPLLTSAGHYSEVVLPEALARNRRFGEVRLRQTPPVGTHPGVAPLVARRVTELLRERQLEREDVALVLVGHGTRRHPAEPGRHRAARRDAPAPPGRRRGRGGVPRRRSAARRVAAAMRRPTVLVVPFLIGGGTHALEDMPRLVGLAADATEGARG